MQGQLPHPFYLRNEISALFKILTFDVFNIFSIVSQRIMSVIPARFAARIFFNTTNRQHFSAQSNFTVMANFNLTLRCVNADAREVSMVMLAEGPSFGVVLREREYECPIYRTHDNQYQNLLHVPLNMLRQFCADSFITSPKFPVSNKRPLPCSNSFQ